MEPLTRTEALVGVALCAAYADGSMDASEDEELAEDIGSWRVLDGIDEAQLRAAMVKADSIATDAGEGALLTQAAAALPEALRPTAFCLATSLVLADGEVAAEERAFIDRLRHALGVPESLAGRIVEVLAIRNRA